MTINKLKTNGFAVSDTYEPQLSGRAKELFDKWQSTIQNLADNFSAHTIEVPTCIAKSTLDTAEYTRNFPQHVMSCQNSTGRNIDDRRATPATCLHIYPKEANSQLSNTAVSYFCQTTCRRKEAEEWSPPFVLQAFTMSEVAVLGSREQVQQIHQSFQETAAEIFYDQDIETEITPATDAFFLGDDSGAKYMQKLKELKHEFVASVGEKTVPIASVNLHEDYFGQRFNITDPAGDPCWSACLAFGLERIVACDILQNE